MTKFNAKLQTIWTIVWAHSWMLFTDDRVLTAAGDHFIEEMVPKMYEGVTQINLKHKAKRGKLKMPKMSDPIIEEIKE